MTEDETLMIMDKIEHLWPGRPYDVEARLAVWAADLASTSYTDAERALTALSHNGHKFPPGPPDIHRQINGPPREKDLQSPRPKWADMTETQRELFAGVVNVDPSA